MPRQADIVVGLDVGATKICAIVGEIKPGGVDVIGVGCAVSKGLRKGMVINIETTVESIKKAVHEAGEMAGVEIRSVAAGIAGGHVKGFSSRGAVAVRDGEVGQADVDRAIDAAKAVAIPIDREILHVIVRGYSIDGQDGIENPLGMSGSRLEADVHIVTGAVSAVRNLVKCCEKAGLEVSDIVLDTIASAEAVLTKDEKELGVALVDIGGDTTDIAIFRERAIRGTAVIAIGGNHFSTDLAVGLRIPPADAERMKIDFGTSLVSRIKKNEMIRVKGIAEGGAVELPRRYLVEIIQPRADELLRLIEREIRGATADGEMPAAIVLTGGACLLDGFRELTEEILGIPARRGIPAGAGGLAELVNTPAHATGVGLLLRMARTRGEARDDMLADETDEGETGEDGAFRGVLERMKSWAGGILGF